MRNVLRGDQMADKTALPQSFEIGVKCLALLSCLIALTIQDSFGKSSARVDGVHVDAEGTERIRQGLG